jgi:hypothetical protein
MNRDCHGDFYTLYGGRFYWCFLDSTVMPAANLRNGDRCHNCERVISGDECGEAEGRIRIVVEARHSGGWHRHSEVIAPSAAPSDDQEERW